MKIRRFRWLQLVTAASVLSAVWLAPSSSNSPTLPRVSSAPMVSQLSNQIAPAESWQRLMSSASW